MTMESVILAIRTNMLIGGARIDPRFRELAHRPLCSRVSAAGCPSIPSIPSFPPIASFFQFRQFRPFYVPSLVRRTFTALWSYPDVCSGNGPEYTEMEAREAFNRMMREHGWF